MNTHTILITLLALSTPLGLAQTASFTPVPTVTAISGASHDGGVLCGRAGSSTAVRIVGSTVTALPHRVPSAPNSSAALISGDGRVVVGYSSGMVRWTDGGAPQTLGDLPGATQAGVAQVSYDGAVIVGTARDSTYPEGQVFRWTQAGGIVGVGALPGSHMPGIRGMSAEGATLCGDCTIPHPTLASARISKGWRWTSAGGLAELPALPGDNATTVTAVLRDGTTFGFSSYVAPDGGSRRPDGTYASYTQVRWDAAGAVAPLPLPAGVSHGAPSVLAPDGSAILGQGDGRRAVLRWTASSAEMLGIASTTIFSRLSYLTTEGTVLSSDGELWSPAGGSRDLKSVLLESYGLEAVRRWTEFSRATLLRRAGDVLILAGTARTPEVGDAQSQTRTVAAWIARVPAPGGALADPFDGSMLSKTAALTPRASFRESYQETAIVYRDPPEDFGDGVVLPGALNRERGGRWTASISVTGSIAGLDLATLTAATPVRLRVGEFYFSKTLGEADHWAPGRMRATFTLPNGRLTVVWNARTITYTATSAAADRLVRENDPDLGLSSFVQRFQHGSIDWIAFRNYFGAVVSPEPTRDVLLRLAVGFADRTGAHPLVLSGRGTQVARGEESDGTVFYLRTVNVVGVADFTPPAVAFVSPAPNAVLFSPTLNGDVRLRRAASMSVRINGGAYTTRDFNGQYVTDQWPLNGLQLQPGVNVIEVKVADLSGNESAPLRRTVTYSTLEGTYSALVEAGGAEGGVAGHFTLSATRARTFTGRLTVGGATHGFRGAFAADGTATVQVARRRLAPITLRLQATVPTDGRATVAGAFTLDTTDYALDAGRAKQPPASGSWAVVLPPDAATLADATLPRGTGFGVLSIAASGAARIAGRVADGTPFSFAASLDWRGRFPIHAPLRYVRATGLLTGLVEMNLPNPWASGLAGEVAWQKPAQAGAARFPQAFTLSSTLSGGSVSSAPFFPSTWTETPTGLARVSANTTLLVEKSLALTRGRAVVTNPGADKLSLRFARGLVTGSVLLPGQARAASLFGVAYQGADGITTTRGFCHGATASDDFRLTPNP